MSDPIVLAAEAAGVAALVGAGVWATQDRTPLATRELLLPGPLAPPVVEELVRLVAASSSRRPVTLTLDATSSRVRLFLTATTADLSKLSAGWLALTPGISAAEEQVPHASFLLARRLRLHGNLPVLRQDAAELASGALFGALRPLADGERLRVVARLWPLRSHQNLPETSSDIPLRRLQAKYHGEPLVALEVVAGATRGPEARADALLHRVFAPLRARTGPRGRLVTARARGQRAQNWLAAPLPWWTSVRRLALSPSEATSLLPLPLGPEPVPGLRYATTPRRQADPTLPMVGRTWGTSTWPGQETHELRQPLAAIAQHSLITGPTGVGKSSLILGLARQALDAGTGLLLLDVKGDVSRDLLKQIPEGRDRDVVVFDPARGPEHLQPGLRVFGRSTDPDLTADLFVSTFSELFPELGVRTKSYLRLGTQTLARTPGATLLELPLLFGSPSRRRQVVGRLKEPLLLAAWQRFEAMSAAEQSTHVAPLLHRLDELLSRPAVRVVLGQPNPKIHFGEILARGRVVVVRIPRGLLGEAAARLLASLILWQAFSAVMARAALDRRPIFEIFLDEAGALGRLPLPLDALLEQARGLGVGVCVAPQSLAQLPTSLRNALTQNAGTICAFRQQDPDEAKAVARMLPGISPEDLQTLGQHEVALRLGVGPGAVSSVMTGRTHAPPEPISDPEAVARRAAQRWGASLAEVDARYASSLGLAGESLQPSPDADGPPKPPPGQRRSTS